MIKHVSSDPCSCASHYQLWSKPDSVMWANAVWLRSCGNQKKSLYLLCVCMGIFFSWRKVWGRICQNVTLFRQNLLPFCRSFMVTGFSVAILWARCTARIPFLPQTHTEPLKKKKHKKTKPENPLLPLRQLYNQKEGPSWYTIDLYKCVWINLQLSDVTINYFLSYKKWLHCFSTNLSISWISSDSLLQE